MSKKRSREESDSLASSLILRNVHAVTSLVTQNNQNTPLHMASWSNDEQYCYELLRSGANPNVTDSIKNTPLHIASSKNFQGICAMLLSAGANHNMMNEDSLSPLYIAASKNHKEICAMLLSAGANPNLSNNNIGTPLHIAVTNGCVEICNMLLESGANPYGGGLHNCSPVYIASLKNHKEICAMLLCAGANPNISNNNIDTPLHIAVTNGFVEICNMLLAFGANPDGAGSPHCSPLYLGVKEGNIAITSLLLKAGANVNIASGIGNEARNTALHLAALRGYGGICKLLIKSGADTQARNKKREMPLKLAANSNTKYAIEEAIKEVKDLTVAFYRDLDKFLTLPLFARYNVYKQCCADKDRFRSMKIFKKFINDNLINYVFSPKSSKDLQEVWDKIFWIEIKHLHKKYTAIFLDIAHYAPTYEEVSQDILLAWEKNPLRLDCFRTLIFSYLDDDDILLSVDVVGEAGNREFY